MPLSQVKTEHEAAVWLLKMILAEKALIICETLKDGDELADYVIDLGKLLRAHERKSEPQISGLQEELILMSFHIPSGR